MAKVKTHQLEGGSASATNTGFKVYAIDGTTAGFVSLPSNDTTLIPGGPTVTTDAANGFQIGDTVVDSAGNLYRSVDSTTGAAVWKKVNDGTLEIVEAPVGTVDGTNAAFTLSQTPVGEVLVMVNGLPQIETVDYAVAGTTVTFTGGNLPITGDVVQVKYAQAA